MTREVFALRVSLFNPLMVVGSILIAATVLILFFVIGPTKPGSILILAPIPLGIAGFIAFGLYFRFFPPNIVVDARGILDPRLGTGVIRWSDITEIETVDYGRVIDFGIGIRVKDLDEYLWAISNPLKRYSVQHISNTVGGYLCIKLHGYDADIYAIESTLKSKWKESQMLTTG